jgi:RNA polymerase sigma-70 factor (ECF subfamily)
MATPATVQIQVWVDRLQAGDETARRELVNCACERLTRLTRAMLKGYARLKRWEQTDDVFQNAVMRLYRALQEVHPASAAEFFRLAALNIRRELLDMVKHYYGPQGEGAHHASVAGAPGADSGLDPLAAQADTGDDPGDLASWAEFHRRVEALPEAERAVVDLLWYQGLSQAEAADLLGVSERTIKRRWASARLRLHELLRDALPGD